MNDLDMEKIAADVDQYIEFNSTIIGEILASAPTPQQRRLVPRLKRRLRQARARGPSRDLQSRLFDAALRSVARGWRPGPA